MPSQIPLPSRSIVARWLIPTAIIGATLAALALSGFEAMRPATPVRVASVVSLSRTDSGAAARVAADSAGAASVANAPDGAPAPSVSAPPTMTDPVSSRWVQAPGWIEPDPQPVIVSALRDGILEQVLVLEGDRVERHAPVAQLESRSAQLALQRAKAELARAEADRERSMAMAEDARTEQAQLPFRRAAAQARFDAAKDATERADRLAKSNAMGESEVVRLHNAMLEARAELEVIEPRLRAIAAGIRAAETAAASATLVPQAMLDEAALAYERSTVRSPIDGVVMEVHALPGQSLFAGDLALGRAVVTLYDPRRLRVRADVPLSDAAGLAIGQKARVTVEVLPDRVFEGVITRLVHKADIQKNTVAVKVTLTDPSAELKPDMLARVRLEVATPAGRGAAAEGGALARLPLMARTDALIGDGAERTVFVVTALDRGRGRVDMRRVRVDIGGDGPREGWTSILDGVALGDRLVLDPAPSLADGTTVVITETLIDSQEVAHAAR